MNSRDRFRSTIQVMNAGRPVFLPLIYGLAARIEQVPLMDMVLDPTYYANLLDGAYKLLKHDAIITNFDPSLEAEIFGAQVEWKSDYDLPQITDWASCGLETASLETSGRIPIMLEAIKRLVQTRGKEAAIVGAVTGPCSLARMIADKAKLEKEYQFEEVIALTGNQLTKLVRSLCDAKVDAILIREDLLGENYRTEWLAREKPYTGIYTTIFNLTKFYNISALLMVRGPELSAIEEIGKKLRPGGIVLSGMPINRDGLVLLKNMSDALKLAIGLPIPLVDPAEMLSRFAVLDEFANQSKPKGFFYTSDGEIFPQISLEVISDLVTRIKGEQGGD
jgi:hypothetical protein